MQKLKERKKVYLNRKRVLTGEMIKKSVFKTVAIFVIASLNWTGLLAVGQTVSAFNDTENSEENIFSASTLYFSLNSLTGFSPELLKAGEDSTRVVNVVKEGSLDFEYRISSKDLSGDLCNYVTLEANLNGDGLECANTSLSGFACEIFSYSEPADWDFKAVLSSETPDDLKGSVCDFKLIFDAWQEGFVYGVGGFTDTQEIENTIRMDDFTPPPPTPISGVVLNEFLPNPDGDFGGDNSNKPLGEWVELYNNSDSSVDLAGWYVTDFSGGVGNTIIISAENITAHLLPETTTISAHGFIVIYMNKAILNNTGDTVRLFNASDELVDIISYENAPENKSFARIPDGTGDWVDPIPTPGAPNIAEEAEVVVSAPAEVIEAVEPIEEVTEEENIVEETVSEETALVEEIVEEVTEALVEAPVEEYVVEEVVVEIAPPLDETQNDVEAIENNNENEANE